MSTIKAKNIKQTVISGTTQPLKIGGILEDGSDAKITIDTSGNVSLNNLSNTLNLTSGQIKFPATQNPSADANTLDDYEEGTWTPVIPNATVNYSVRHGFYTKIGNVVYIYAFIVVNTITINTNDFQVFTGLPFVSAGGNRYPPLTTAWNSLNDFGRSTIFAQVSTSSTNVSVIGCSNNTSYSDLPNSIFKNGSWLKFSGFYHVD